MKKIIVTIDGPAASGKEKISKYINKKWGLVHLDSGMLYRRLASILLKEKINLNNKNDVKKQINTLKVFNFKNNKALRSQIISEASSKIAIYSFVRDFINQLQYDFVKKNENPLGFVIDGRDIGSKVFKNADLKLYIDVNPIIRAKRRYKQLIDNGEKSIYPQILKDIKLRDKKDKNRINSPLVIPKGAIIVDNNGSFKRTITKINNLMNRI